MIETPTLIIDEALTKKNIQKMVEKAKNAGVSFRPHFKTHQSHQIARWFREFGVKKITVSSVKMAQYFVEDGWKDILIAFPVNILEIDAICHLAELVNLQILVDHPAVIPLLENTLTSSVGVWVKIDVGYHRSGIFWNKVEEIETLIQCIQDTKKLTLEGVLTHAGHSYQAKSVEEIKSIFNTTRERLINIKKFIHSKFDIHLKISIGDTPGCTISTDFTEIDEMRPGNFVFYDLQQFCLGVCELSDISVHVACPVVGIYPNRDEVVIYGGAIHFSKDYVVNSDAQIAYGFVKELKNKNENLPVNGFVRSISQEHGVVKIQSDQIHLIKIGDILEIFPAHSCLTLQAMQTLNTTTGDIISTMLSCDY